MARKIHFQYHLQPEDFPLPKKKAVHEEKRAELSKPVGEQQAGPNLHLLNPATALEAPLTPSGANNNHRRDEEARMHAIKKQLMTLEQVIKAHAI